MEKKTDQQKFVELYESIGIPVKIEDYDNEGCKMIKLSGVMFEGYMGFYSTIVFDETGRFVRQSFWE